MTDKPEWLGQSRMLKDDEMDAESRSLLRSIDYVLETGLPMPKMDKREIQNAELPADPSALSDDELLREMAFWTRILSYTKFEAAKADADKTAKQNRYRMHRAKAYLEFRKTMTDAEAKEKVHADPYLSKLLISAEVASSKYKLLEALLYGYRQNYNMLSRELTKRGIVFDPESRDTD